MYAQYGTQVSVIMAGSGRASIIDKGLLLENAKVEDLQRMLDQVGIVSCKKCGKPAFDTATVNTNRDGECEACFMERLNAECAKATEKENKRFAKLDEKHKKQGFTHRVDAWIHPEAGGDDRQVSFYVKGEPTNELIQKQLKKSRSSKLDDYMVVEL
jgi:hypothetical protein